MLASVITAAMNWAIKTGRFNGTLTKVSDFHNEWKQRKNNFSETWL
jgi:hypothetical protein